MKIIVIGSRAYNELVGRIEKIEAAIASLPEKGRAWNNDKMIAINERNET